MKIALVTIAIVSLFYGCDAFFCGKLDKEYQVMIDSVNEKYSHSFLVQHIPCEQISISLHLITDHIDSIEIRDAHKILYNSNLNIGWQTINIYNKKGSYICSHSYRDYYHFREND